MPDGCIKGNQIIKCTFYFRANSILQKCLLNMFFYLPSSLDQNPIKEVDDHFLFLLSVFLPIRKCSYARRAIQFCQDFV